jgi:hypothetical protein
MKILGKELPVQKKGAMYTPGIFRIIITIPSNKVRVGHQSPDPNVIFDMVMIPAVYISGRKTWFWVDHILPDDDRGILYFGCRCGKEEMGGNEVIGMLVRVRKVITSRQVINELAHWRIADNILHDGQWWRECREGGWA